MLLFLIEDSPPEYTEKYRVSGDDNMNVFNFVLPLVECPDKRGPVVGGKIKDVLALVGLLVCTALHHTHWPCTIPHVAPYDHSMIIVISPSLWHRYDNRGMIIVI